MSFACRITEVARWSCAVRVAPDVRSWTCSPDRNPSSSGAVLRRLRSPCSSPRACRWRAHRSSWPREAAVGRVRSRATASSSVTRRARQERVESLAAASVDAQGVEPLSPIADDTVVVELPPGTSVAAAIAELEDRPGVAFAEPDYRLTIAATSDDPQFTGGSLWGMYGSGRARPTSSGRAPGRRGPMGPSVPRASTSGSSMRACGSTTRTSPPMSG